MGIKIKRYLAVLLAVMIGLTATPIESHAAVGDTITVPFSIAGMDVFTGTDRILVTGTNKEFAVYTTSGTQIKTGVFTGLFGSYGKTVDRVEALPNGKIFVSIKGLNVDNHVVIMNSDGTYIAYSIPYNFPSGARPSFFTVNSSSNFVAGNIGIKKYSNTGLTEGTATLDGTAFTKYEGGNTTWNEGTACFKLANGNIMIVGDHSYYAILNPTNMTIVTSGTYSGNEFLRFPAKFSDGSAVVVNYQNNWTTFTSAGAVKQHGTLPNVSSVQFMYPAPNGNVVYKAHNTNVLYEINSSMAQVKSTTMPFGFSVIKYLGDGSAVIAGGTQLKVIVPNTAPTKTLVNPVNNSYYKN